jgi:hypothetical protein
MSEIEADKELNEIHAGKEENTAADDDNKNKEEAGKGENTTGDDSKEEEEEAGKGENITAGENEEEGGKEACGGGNVVECESCHVQFKHQRNLRCHVRKYHRSSSPSSSSVSRSYTRHRKSAFNGLVRTMSFVPRKETATQEFFKLISPKIRDELEEILKHERKIKWHLLSTFRGHDPMNNFYDDMYLVNRMEVLTSGDNVEEAVKNHFSKMVRKIQKGEEEDSGLLLENIKRVDLTTIRYNP